MDNRIQILESRALRGPNLYAYMPVLKVVMDIGAYDEIPSSDFPGFTDRLVSWLPGIEKHECSVGKPGGFIERLRRGTYLPHITEHITLELQTMMGFSVGFGRARGTGVRGVYNVVIEYHEEEPARAAFDLAMRLIFAAMDDAPFDIHAECDRLMEISDEYRLGPSTAAIVEAARRRRIPVIRLTDRGSLIQLGYGVYQKRILASQTSDTSAIAVDLCQEKPLTNKMLRDVGVPVPEGRSARSADEAWQVAQEIGVPVVVKPEAGNQGKGVSTNLMTEAQIKAAYEIAKGFGGNPLVERCVKGQDYRLLVVNGKMVAAAQRNPAQVTGDGKRTVQALVDEVNRDPRRRNGHSSVMTRITLDDAVRLVLQQQHLTVDSVPSKGQIVRLRTNANLSTGGTSTDVTADVHPANAQLAELAAQILALDVAGIDIVAENISRPLTEQGGAIVEVNAAPGLRMHLAPAFGQPRPVAEPIVDMLYPDGTPSRIPIIAITGTNGKTTTTRLISHMFETAHWVVGMTGTEGTYVNGQRILEGDTAGPKSARAVLMHPRVEVAVLETARGGILREGLAFDECAVGVVTNIASDHLGLGGIDTLDDLAQVKQVVIEAVAKNGAAVLNADDRRVAEMAAATDAKVIYFSANPHNPIITAHLAEGGSAVLARKGSISLLTPDAELDLIELERIPFTFGGKVAFQVQNALAATAAAWGAGLNPALIVRALTTFETSESMVPGRFNLMDINGIEVLLDYGHNAAAITAIAEAFQVFESKRTIMVLGLPGDRRDEDLIATFEASQAFVDEYILHDLETDQRGRKKHEIPLMLQAQLPQNCPSTIVDNQEEAILEAWKRLMPGDRLVVIADLVEKSLETLHYLAESIAADNRCTTPLSPYLQSEHRR